MITKQHMHYFYALMGCLILWSMPAKGVLAQPADITLELSFTQQMNNAQVLGISSLGINSTGNGRALYTLTIQNNGKENVEELYLDIQISSNNVGLIAEAYTANNTPFHLRPRQRVRTTNQQLQKGLPGVRDFMELKGEYTTEGTDFLNDLQGSTNLPADIYSVTLGIYQGANRLSGGTQIASVTEEFGSNIASDSNIDLYLLQPGGEQGSDELINSAYPVFWWSGPNNLRYRLIVVEGDGQSSAETLIQSAFGTDPVRGIGNTGGTLLESELIDVELSQTTYSMQPSGTQSLESGSTYYWQVFTIRKGVNASETTSSEIFEFTYEAPTSSSEAASYSAEQRARIRQSLNAILGGQMMSNMSRGDMDFDALIIDGVSYQGDEAVLRLQELGNKVRDGSITIVN